MTKRTAPNCPLSADEVLDLYFVEHRAKLIDVAAFLDRIDRAAGAEQAQRNHRLAALRGAIALLDDGQPDRARRILEHLSDPTTEPIAEAGTKGATGAPPQLDRAHPAGSAATNQSNTPGESTSTAGADRR